MSASGRAICAILALVWTVAAFAAPAEALSCASRCPSEHDADSFSTKGVQLGGQCKGTKYNYDAKDRRSKAHLNHLGEDIDYDYDPHDRLTGEKWKNVYLRNAKWTYDAAGNRKTQKVDGILTNYSYDAQNRLTSETKAGLTTTYLNDRNGNRTRKTAGTATEENYGFDYMNRISAYAKNPVGLAATASWQYLFTPTAERIAKIDLLSPAANEQWFMSEGADVTADYTRTTGTPLYTLDRTYANGRAIDSKLARFDNPGDVTYLYLGDALGTVHQEVTTTGAVVRQELTTAWGEQHLGYTPVSILSDRYGFTQREQDAECSLMHYRARSYDPGTGRFTARDQVSTPNLYSYVESNPANATDPTGRFIAFIAGYEILGAVPPARQAFATSLPNEIYLDNVVRQLAAPGKKNTDPPSVYSWDDKEHVVKDVKAALKANPDEPIIVMGYSYGGDSAVAVTEMLKDEKVMVDLLVQIDSVGVGDAEVPLNVLKGLNIYQHRGWLEGIFAPLTVLGQQDVKGSILGITNVEAPQQDTYTWSVATPTTPAKTYPVNHANIAEISSTVDAIKDAIKKYVSVPGINSRISGFARSFRPF